MLYSLITFSHLTPEWELILTVEILFSYTCIFSEILKPAHCSMDGNCRTTLGLYSCSVTAV